MNRTFGLLAMVSLCVLMLTVLVGPVAANFINGSFEDGTFSGWTLAGGTWAEAPQGSGTVVYSPTGDPGKSEVVGPGLDPLTNNNLSTVYNGNFAARVNNFDNSYHYTTLEQQVTGWDQDTIYFAWAAVLEEPVNQHNAVAAPHFSLTLNDVTRGTTLYQQAFTVYDAPGGAGTWHTGAVSGTTGNWLYTDWVVAQLDTSLYRGDTLNLTVAAYDCGWGGHGGYAYVDAFGPAPPEPNGTPEPGTLLLLGIGLTGGAFKLRTRKAASAA